MYRPYAKSEGIHSRRFNNVQRLFLAGAFFMLFAFVPAPGISSSATEIGHRAPAADLSSGLRMQLRADPAAEYNWTLIWINGEAREQETEHPERNVIKRLWHCPLAQGRHAFKLEFTRPYMEGNHALHLYIEADGDRSTGRKEVRGVDYIFTMINAKPQRASLGRYGDEGRAGSGGCSVAIRGDAVYLSADMSIRQVDGKTVFEYNAWSFLREEPGGGRMLASSRSEWALVSSEGEPDIPGTAINRLINPEMKILDGFLPGWQFLKQEGSGAAFYECAEEGVTVVADMLNGDSLLQTASLVPGHYVFRALVSTSSFPIHLVVDRTRMPIGVSDGYKWAELPFYVPGDASNFGRHAQLGFRYHWQPATGHVGNFQATVRIKQTDIVRLGDTPFTSYSWVENMPVDPIHGLELINEQPDFERPGKVIFHDSFIGTEMWLMTQAGQSYESYVGTQDFSHGGRYLRIGYSRPPRGLLRTDGSLRMLDIDWRREHYFLVWLFPWEERRLPEGADPEDWISLNRTFEKVTLFNVETGETVVIDFPKRPGWNIIHFPSVSTHGGRGPKIKSIDYETLVWQSEDRRKLGLSDIEGNNFRSFEVRSISPKPGDDVIYPSRFQASYSFGTSPAEVIPMSNVGGKWGDNWRNAVDRDGNRYFVFEINRDNFTDHPTNPFQVWALCLTHGDVRGLLRAVHNPAGEIGDRRLTSLWGGRELASINWWEFTAGFPYSGDSGVLLLEDGTLIHMSSLGMHSGFAHGRTVNTNCPYSGEVNFIGTFARIDRVSWPHEWRHDRDFASLQTYCEPVAPMLMLDLENNTMWAAVFSNFHDYTRRYAGRRTGYPKPLMRPAPTPSADYTKISYFSSMLTGDHPERRHADAYVAVARYPQPPANVRLDGNRLAWDMPRYHAEIKGFNVYRSDESGRGFARLNAEPVKGTEYAVPGDGFYVLTSVEHSGLESRMFSNEAHAGRQRVFRHFYQPPEGRLTSPMVPFFEPKGASNSYAVAVTDPELLYKKRLEEGLEGSASLDVRIPVRGRWRILARVRGMSRIERASYITGWAPEGEAGSGSFALRMNGREVGSIPVSGYGWRWVELDGGTVNVSPDVLEIEFATSDAGIALDNVLVTNDPEFMPVSADNTPVQPPSAPSNVRAEVVAVADSFNWRGYEIRAPYVKLTWEESVAPQGVRYYNVYRSEERNFEPSQATLLGSTIENVFMDHGLGNGKTYYYRVVAVDNWDNRSGASAVLPAVSR